MNGKWVIAGIIAIFILSVMSVSCEDSYNDSLDYDAINTYNWNHRDDWKGYKGTRRNSMGEDGIILYEDIIWDSVGMERIEGVIGVELLEVHLAVSGNIAHEIDVFNRPPH